MAATPVRSESDLLGTRDVPADAYYGIHTLRASENFLITGTPISTYPGLIGALAATKQAAALANRRLGLLPAHKADAIVAAAGEIRAGRLHEQFVVDVLQGGAGTSTNMNVNEVICNRALELLGHAKGAYHELHPLDDVNCGQSTNDVYPTAVRVTLHEAVGRLRLAIDGLARQLEAKAAGFGSVLKVGRTQLQDAIPMTLEQELSAHAITLREDLDPLADAAARLSEVNLGGTAIGTGLTAHRDYSRLACEHLSELVGAEFVPAPDLIEATQDTGAYVALSGTVKRTAVKLSKICNDLRLVSSGPRAGFGELTLPAVQAGSSLMPGKVNPVIPEVVNQVAFEVIGNDLTVTFAAEAGQLQLNAFLPVIAHSLFKSVEHLAAACETLGERCIAGISANVEALRQMVERSTGLATALKPEVGYALATTIAQTALETGESVYSVALASGILDRDLLERLSHPESLTRPGYPGR